MRSATTSFPVSRFIAASLMLVIGAVLWLTTSMVQAQTVAGYGSGGHVITAVTSKGAGQADVTITGVALKSSLSYCLIGVGRGHWHAKKLDGGMQFDLSKVACAKSDGAKVIVPLRLDAKYYQQGGLTMGYVPVSVSANGMLADWQSYPAGAQKFEKNDGKQADIIAIHWTADGFASVATAGQALNIND
jgi:hypothetical protein